MLRGQSADSSSYLRRQVPDAVGERVHLWEVEGGTGHREDKKVTLVEAARQGIIETTEKVANNAERRGQAAVRTTRSILPGCSADKTSRLDRLLHKTPTWAASLKPCAMLPPPSCLSERRRPRPTSRWSPRGSGPSRPGTSRPADCGQNRYGWWETAECASQYDSVLPLRLAPGQGFEGWAMGLGSACAGVAYWVHGAQHFGLTSTAPTMALWAASKSVFRDSLHTRCSSQPKTQMSG